MLYVDAGTVHAVGPNSILVETQQNCDITYRLYDYGRPRELHLELGMAAIRDKTHAGLVQPQLVQSQMAAPHAGDAHQLLVASPSFIVEKHQLTDPVAMAATPSSVQVLVSLDGGAVVECPGAPSISMMRGDTVIIPASSPAVTLRPQWSAEILRMTLPSQTVAEPLTTLNTTNASSSPISHT
jgi:mannose-6-phosphate isomerase